MPKNSEFSSEFQTPKTKNLVKHTSEDGQPKFMKSLTDQKSQGATQGLILYSQSKEDGRQKKWLAKYSIFDKLSNENQVSILSMHKLLTSEDVAKHDICNAGLNLIEHFNHFIFNLETHFKDKFPNIEKVSQALDSLKDLNIKLFSITDDKEWSNDVKRFWELANKVNDYTVSAGKKASLIQNTKEVIGSEFSRLVTKRETTPKGRILHDKESVTTAVLSRIAFNTLPDGTAVEQSMDLFDFVDKVLHDHFEQELAKPELGRLEKLKPIKGIYEAIIVRLFLGDFPGDIKLGNMLVVENPEYYQIENIDFGNIMVNAYKLDDKILEPLNLINTISEITTSLTEGDDFYSKSFLKIADASEINTTIKDISELKDEDLIDIVNNLDQLKNSEGSNLVLQEQKEIYLKFFQKRRSQMQDLLKTIDQEVENKKPAKAAIENKKPDEVLLGKSNRKRNPESDPNPNSNPKHSRVTSSHTPRGR
jgi:hypothetical protein